MGKIKTKDQAKQKFTEAVDAYCLLFAAKHGDAEQYNRNDWLRGDVGGTLEFADRYIDFGDIRTDIDMDAPKGELAKWYDYSEEILSLGCSKSINYRSWLKGAPKPYSNEDIAKICKAKLDLRMAEIVFSQTLDMIENGEDH